MRASRRIPVVLLICLLPANAVFAADQASGLMATAVRETARLASLEAQAAQPSGTPEKERSGHPVLIGAAVGAAALGVASYVGTSCSVPPPNDVAACGSHYKGGFALLGAGVGAGVGALVGLAFRR
jgi:hypothetical protein